MTLSRPNFIEYDRQGRMIRLFCSVCGTQIGEDQRGNFIRFPNYGELKMQFADGSKHVTNLCHTCIPIVADSRELMFEVYQADIDDMARDMPSMALQKLKFAPKFVEVDLTRSGLP